MYTGPLWEADFNTNDTVLSTMYFLKEQVLNACETSPGSRVPDKTSFVWRAGVWTMVDGKPAAVMQEAIRAKPAYWEPIRVGSGGLHWEYAARAPAPPPPFPLSRPLGFSSLR